MGAWDFGYIKPKIPRMRGDNDRLGLAIIAFKNELVFKHNLTIGDLSSPIYGSGAIKAVKEVQGRYGLIKDGVIGPNTANALFTPRLLNLEKWKRVPDRLLSRMVALESAFDPVATGWADPRDRGLAQISSFWHSYVTDQKAYNPSYALPWAVTALRDGYDAFKDWEVAVAAHNVGTGGARNWFNAGKPSMGGPDWFPRLYETATRYVNLVKVRKVI